MTLYHRGVQSIVACAAVGANISIRGNGWKEIRSSMPGPLQSESHARSAFLQGCFSTREPLSLASPTYRTDNIGKNDISLIPRTRTPRIILYLTCMSQSCPRYIRTRCFEHFASSQSVSHLWFPLHLPHHRLIFPPICVVLHGLILQKSSQRPPFGLAVNSLRACGARVRV